MFKFLFMQQRNLYNKIFGGFLMRQAYELAWINASLYCKSKPKISVVDNISFRRPVLIGSLLLLTSQVVYTEANSMMIRVHAENISPATQVHEMTNEFYFRFDAPADLIMSQVFPKTYAESMMFIDGKRHW